MTTGMLFSVICKKTGLRLLANMGVLLTVLCCALPVSAMDGFAIVERGITKSRVSRIEWEILLNFTNSVGLWRYDISDDKVVGSKRISDYRALFPTISPDGKYVAFYRQNTRVDEAGKPMGAVDEKWYLSVMKTDGTEMRDVVSFVNEDAAEARGDFAIKFGKTNHPLKNALVAGQARISWPIGGWIYYNKPFTPSTAGLLQVWRVKADDPRQNELSKDFSANPPQPAATLERFSLNVTGDRFATRILYSAEYGGNDAYAVWPPKDPQDGRATAVGGSKDSGKGGRILRCMVQISSSGRYLVTFTNYDHKNLMVHQWDFAKNEIHPRARVSSEDLTKWLNTTDEARGQFIRGAVNSDKWICLMRGSDSVLVNWVDGKAILLPRAGGNKVYQGPGNLWVNGGPDSSYETSKGVWLAYGKYDLTPDVVAKVEIPVETIDPTKPLVVGKSPQVKVQAQLVEKTTWKKEVALTAGYPRVLIVHRYKVERVLGGQYKEEFVHVAHWGAWGRQPVKEIIDRTVGKSYQLVLEAMDKYEILESEQILNDIEADIDLPIMFDVAGVGVTTVNTPQAPKKPANK